MQVNLTQKERMLLEDQKKAEQLCIEKYTNYSNQTNDAQLKQVFNTNLAAEKQHLDTINQLLNNQMPNLNQQQNANQMAGQNNTQMPQQNMVTKKTCKRKNG
jgi:spore coat protein CotF